MKPIQSEILCRLGDLADPEGRQSAAAALARCLGGDSLILLSPDPELGVPLPAPGLPQTLRAASEWRTFIAECVRTESHTGMLPASNGQRRRAVGIASPDGTVAILLSDEGSAADLTPLRPVLPLLGALFTQEREVDAGKVKIDAAKDAAHRATRLTEALQEMRVKLESALAEAREARAHAKERTVEAEEFAQELQTQAVQLEEQTTELEMLNDALAVRSEEAELARTAADAANRAKSEFLANMSHELRTPINAVIGYTELLDMGITGPVTPDQRAQLERIRASSAHLLTLVNDVLDLAKVEAGRMTVGAERESAREVVDEALALVEMQAVEEEIELTSDCSDADATYVGDRDRVRQILANLLSNAVKFTHPGGSVKLRCGMVDEADVTSDLKSDGPWLYIEVEDTGIGLNADEVKRVFQPFIQAEGGRTRSHGGTGLGLTISRQLARLMGGELTASSEPGVGSKFALWLPSRTTEERSLDPDIRVGAGKDRTGWPVGLDRVGAALQLRTRELTVEFIERIRSQTSATRPHLNESEILDHVPTLVADIARMMMTLGRTGGDPTALRDNSDIQRIIAEHHGADRARRGWTAEHLNSDFEILREEIVNVVQESLQDAEDEVDFEGSFALLDQLLDWAKRASLRSHHAALVADSSLADS